MTQKILSLLAGFISVAMMYLISSVNSWWMFLGMVFLWLSILICVTAYLNAELEKKFVNLPIVLLTIVGFIGLILVSEWIVLRYLLMAGAGVVMWFVFSRMEGVKTGLSYELKPVRRLVMVLMVFDLYALSAIVYALDMFFQAVPFWLMSMLLAFIYSMVSIKIWKMYFAVPSQSFILLSLAIGLAEWEIIYVLRFLPLGYFVTSALAVWVWYVAHLFTRFHLSQQGIVWKKQIWFISVNAILFFLALVFFVKWI